MVQQIASDPQSQLPISAIGGISGWREAAEFILMGAGCLQACTAPMHYGYRIVEDMVDGLASWMDSKGFPTLDDFRGRSLPRVTDWQHLDQMCIRDSLFAVLFGGLERQPHDGPE